MDLESLMGGAGVEEALAAAQDAMAGGGIDLGALGTSNEIFNLKRKKNNELEFAHLHMTFAMYVPCVSSLF